MLHEQDDPMVKLYWQTLDEAADAVDATYEMRFVGAETDDANTVLWHLRKQLGEMHATDSIARRELVSVVRAMLRILNIPCPVFAQ